jgi:hypothetical protein
MEGIEYLRVGLWVVNALIYASAIRLYLRPETPVSSQPCPICGDHTDPFCVGLYTPAPAEGQAHRLLTAPPTVFTAPPTIAAANTARALRL